MNISKAIFFCGALAVAALFPAERAQAFWGDNGEGPPSFFGVQLGSDIRNYPGMKPLRNWKDKDFASYYREADEKASFEGISLLKDVVTRPGLVRYSTYKNMIYEIYFSVDINNFDKFCKYMDLTYGTVRIATNLFDSYQWGLYETLISALGHFPPSSHSDYGDVVEYLDAVKHYDQFMQQYGDEDPYNSFSVSIEYYPVICKMAKARYHNFKASYRGVVLGTKAKNYSFLQPYKSEEPDLVYYRSTKPLGVVRGIPVIAEEYIAHKGIIYSIEITVKKFSIGEGFLDWSVSDVYADREYGHLVDMDRFMGVKTVTGFYSWVLGDSEFYLCGDKLVYRHFAGYWAAMRAKAAYGRNVKPEP